jgi:hypothetical protein
LCGWAEALRKIHGIVSEVYRLEKSLSGLMEAMIEDLEDNEVQNMM